MSEALEAVGEGPFSMKFLLVVFLVSVCMITLVLHSYEQATDDWRCVIDEVMSVLPVSLRNPNSPSEVSGHVVHERSDNENVEIQKLDESIGY